MKQYNLAREYMLILEEEPFFNYNQNEIVPLVPRKVEPNSSDKENNTNDGASNLNGEKIVSNINNDVIVENEINKKKILILGPYESKESANDYMDYLSKYDDIRTFSMYEEDNLYVVALYMERLNCYINIDDLVTLSNTYFDQGKIKEAIDLLTIACAHREELNPYIFNKLSRICQKIGDYDKALSYCRVCQVMNITYGDTRDLTLVLTNLKRKRGVTENRLGKKA